MNENSNMSPTIESLLKRTEIFIEDGEWNQADAYCEKVLDMDPENAQAYFDKLLIECQIKHKQDLINHNKPLDHYSTYNKIIRFADEILKNEIEEYNTAIKNKIEKEHNTNIYNDAVDILKRANDVKMFKEALALFEQIPGWADADKNIDLCKRKIRENEEANLLRIEREKEEKDNKKNKLRKKLKTITIFLSITVIIVIVFVFVIMPIVKKSKGRKYIEEGNYIDAYKYLCEFTDEESTTLINEIYENLKIESLSAATVGSTVYFGKYDQDRDIKNGKEIISWRVLEKKEGSILVLSEKLIDEVPYNYEECNITWQDCSLRKWLNTDFIDLAFSDDEKLMIEEKYVNADINSNYNNVNQGESTLDKVYLLSVEEVNKYFKNSDKSCYDYLGESLNWWLRTMGTDIEIMKNTYYCPAYITSANNNNPKQGKGIIVSDSPLMTSPCGVRPVMWIKMS